MKARPSDSILSDSNSSILARIRAFLVEIGIPAELVQLDEETFLPGIDIRNGVLLIDAAQLAYPGDILHEAGHLAIVTAERRRTITHDVGADPGEEMAAIAWSYAAAIHLHLEPSVVFHDHGYRGGAQAILDNFGQGRYFGVPLLEWLGLTVGSKSAGQKGVLAYPHMVKWVVD